MDISPFGDFTGLSMTIIIHVIIDMLECYINTIHVIHIIIIIIFSFSERGVYDNTCFDAFHSSTPDFGCEILLLVRNEMIQ